MKTKRIASIVGLLVTLVLVPLSVLAANTFPASGNAGIGTVSPSEDLHIYTADPAIRLDRSDNAGYTQITDQSANIMRLQKEVTSGSAIIVINPVPQDGTSNVEFRFFRQTNTTGVKQVRFLVGDGTNTVDSQIGVDGTPTYFSSKVGIGTSSPSTKLDVHGEATVDVLNITGGSDMAELFNVRNAAAVPQPGMVVSIDPEGSGSLTVSSKAYDRTVAGIIAGAGDLKPGMLMGQQGTLAYGEHPIVLNGRTYCYVDATKTPVKAGDLLTTSDVPGHAMKLTDIERAHGAIIGKAITSLESGRGLVLVLVCLQ